MKAELNFNISCLLLKFENKTVSFSDLISSIDKLVTKYDNEYKLVEISLASTENQVASELYSFLDHRIDNYSYQVLMSDIIKSLNTSDKLIKVDSLIDFLRSKTNNENSLETYSNTPFLEDVFYFLYWCSDELALSRDGILVNADELEKGLNELFEILILFKIDNLEFWNKYQTSASQLMTKIKNLRLKRRAESI